MAGLILHKLQQRGFIGIECMCLTGPPAVKTSFYFYLFFFFFFLLSIIGRVMINTINLKFCKRIILEVSPGLTAWPVMI